VTVDGAGKLPPAPPLFALTPLMVASIENKKVG
jgi:hypothetical protein